MIEIIREENFDCDEEKTELPKNIRQIGTPDIGDRIYIENKAYQTMHSYDVGREKAVYVLLGKFEMSVGKTCVFVEAAICLEEIMFDGEIPIWNDESWAYLYKKLKRAYDDMVIVGWAMDIQGQLPTLTAAVEKIHRTYFGGEHQVLFLMDSLEGEDSFYGMKSGFLRKRTGYYIYYQKKEPEVYRESSFDKESEWEAAEPKRNVERQEHREKTGAYRSYLNSRAQKNRMVPSYGLSVLLFLAVCGLGYAAFSNYEKMNAMEAALTQMHQVQIAATEEQMSSEAGGEDTLEQTTQTAQEDGSVAAEGLDGQSADAQQPEAIAEGDSQSEQEDAAVTVENVQGEVLPEETNVENTDTQNVQEGQADTAQEAQQTEETAAQAMAESRQYLEQGYYIVQKKDNLAGICRKIYQTTAMMDKVCEANGIENPDAIYEGQYLILPN